jgi:hypothetical protein
VRTWRSHSHTTFTHLPTQKAQKAQRRTHKERSQPAKRKRLGLLEKKGTSVRVCARMCVLLFELVHNHLLASTHAHFTLNRTRTRTHTRTHTATTNR